MNYLCNAVFSALIVGATEVAPDVMKIDHYDYHTQDVTAMYIRTEDYVHCTKSVPFDEYL